MQSGSKHIELNENRRVSRDLANQKATSKRHIKFQINVPGEKQFRQDLLFLDAGNVFL